MATHDSVISARSWTLFTAGVALTSSAVTVASVLGWQSFHRRRLRSELEEDVRRAMRRAGGEGEKDEQTSDGAASESNASTAKQSDRRQRSTARDEQHQLQPASSGVPRYLAALAAAQDGTTVSGTSSPRGAVKPSTSVAATLGSPNMREGLLGSPAHSQSARTATQAAPLSRKSTGPVTFDESLIREQLSRNYSFLGEDAMSALRSSFVIVVGAGGVGSWCALMLLRSGVGRLRLIDFDQVSLSSLNRHACATLADVGRPKVQVCKEHFAEIAPWCDVDARVEIFRGSDAQRLLASAKADASRKLEESTPTYVIDCIDNLDTKVDLLAYCYHHKIPCFSSMGAGAKADPSQIQVGDLNTTAEDPLARRVRRALRSKGVWGGGVMAKRKKAKKGKTEKVSKEAEQEANDAEKRKKDQEDALQKLESGGSRSGSGTVPAVRTFGHSGRGVDEGSIGARRTSTQTPSISRRASSNSSVGSAAFFSPLSSPLPDDGTGSFGREDSTIRGFRLPEAALDDETSPASAPVATPPLNEETKEQGTTSASGKPASSEAPAPRPDLAPLQTPISQSSIDARRSRRTSSLKELAAEDMRSSLSGKAARAMSGAILKTHAEESDDEDSVAEDGQSGTKPYTIMCVYTNEKSDTRLLPLDEEEFQKGNVDELAALEDFRVRILPVLGPLPAMFGLAAATYVICDVGGRTLEPLPFKGRRKTAERMWGELETSERRFPSPGSTLSRDEMAIGPRRVPWTAEDVAYVFEEVYRCRSVVPPHETLSLGKLLRWDSTLPLSYSNVALFSKSDGQKHEEQVLKHGRSPVEVWGEEAARMFKRRMAEERRMGVLR